MKTVFVLSGSGARFPFQVGVVEAIIEKNNLNNTECYFLGVSGGAIASAFLASGQKGREFLSEMKERMGTGAPVLNSEYFGRDGIEVEGILDLLGFNFSDLLSALTKRGRKDLLKRKLEKVKDGLLISDFQYIKEYLADKLPDSFPERLGIVTTDYQSLKTSVWSKKGKGKMLDCILASCAFPGVFPPVLINDFYYFDGGITDQSGVRSVRSFLHQLNMIRNSEEEKQNIIFVNARPDTGFPVNYNSIESINRAYLGATKQRYHDLSLVDWQSRFINAGNSISTAYDFSQDAIDNNYLNGLSVGLEFRM